jgi:hypothetical protein
MAALWPGANVVDAASRPAGDPSGDVRVNLDSSTPCWNDGIEAFWPKLTETQSSTRDDLTFGLVLK